MKVPLKKSPLFESQAGYILGLVLVFFVIFTILGLSFIRLGGYEQLQAVQALNKANAFYNAESGIQKGLWLLNRVSTGQASYSDATVTVVFDSANQTLTAVGQSGNASSTIQVAVDQDNPFRHIISYQDKLELNESQVTLSYVPGAEPKQTLHFPVPDMAYYLSIADTFIDLGGTGEIHLLGDTLYGIIYVNGKIRVQNGTVVYGSLVATNDVKFDGPSEIYAQQVPVSNPYYPAYFPAVISGDSVHAEITGTPEQVIHGAVYSAGEAEERGGLWTGPVVADEVEIKNNSTLTDLGSAIYYVHPPGFIYPGNIMGDTTIKPGSWQKL
ncbi:MAG: hypothetical protein ACE5HO_09945 [bacterium]